MTHVRILLAVLLGLLTTAPASAQKTKATIQTEINTLLGDNTSGQITPAKLRTITSDLLNSYVDWLTCAGSGGLVYWNAGTPTCLSAGTNGQVLRTNGTAPSWADFSSNLVAGTGITITGTSPATISITNQIAAGGPTGSATVAPILTYNAQGQLTAVGSATIAPPFSAVTGVALIGQLSAGGTGTGLAASNGGVVWSDAAGLQVLAGTATARFPLLSGSTAAPTWATVQYPASATSGGVACFTSATAMGSSVALTANAIMLGGGAGVCPSVLGSLGTTTTVLHGNAGGAPTFASVAFADISSSDVATSSQYAAGTASKLVQSGAIYPNEVTVTFGSTTTFDFSTFINAVVTLTGNITTQTLSNIMAGKAGTIAFVQDATGSRTTVWNSNFKFAGGATPSLSTTSNAVDVLSYSCRSATNCVATLIKDVR